MTNPNLRELIKLEYENSPRFRNRRIPMMSREEAGMSTEEHEKLRERNSMRFELKSVLHSLFESTLKESNSPKYLLAIPLRLAVNSDIGTNVVMRLFFSDEVTPERIENVKFLTQGIRNESRSYWYESGASYAPSAKDLFWYFHRVNNAVPFISDCTVAECCWLMELAGWAECLSPFFSAHMAKAMAFESSINEIDFFRVLDSKADESLLRAVYEQYNVLEKVLDRM